VDVEETWIRDWVCARSMSARRDRFLRSRSNLGGGECMRCMGGVGSEGGRLMELGGWADGMGRSSVVVVRYWCVCAITAAGRTTDPFSRGSPGAHTLVGVGFVIDTCFLVRWLLTRVVSCLGEPTLE
jgi:hypothetical protein